MASWSEDTNGLVILPDGRRVRGRGLRYGGLSVDARPELGVYLCARSPAPEAWESVWICWPDFLLPLRIAEAVAAFRYAHGEAATPTGRDCVPRWGRSYGNCDRASCSTSWCTSV